MESEIKSPAWNRVKQEKGAMGKNSLLMITTHGSYGMNTPNDSYIYNLVRKIPDICRKSFTEQHDKETVSDETKSYAMHSRRE